MYKIGYKAYGIEIINIIWSEGTVYNKNQNRWVYVCPYYYVRLSKYLCKALLSYQLNTLIEERKYRCNKIIELSRKLTKLMLDSKYEG